MKPKALQIKKAIAGIEHGYPPDDLLKSYKDFTKERELLPHYQYNPKVFESLVKIANDVWQSEKRISRPSLIEFIKRYQQRTTGRNYSAETCSHLFELFRNILSENKYGIGESAYKVMKGQVNIILKDVRLNEEKLQWMINNLNISEHFINRILRYPAKSKVISEWAKENFYTNRYRERRAELTGRMLDQDTEFELTKEVIIEDFDYSLNFDYNALREYKYYNEASAVIERDLADVLPRRDYISPLSGKHINAPFSASYTPLKLSHRFYPFPVYKEDGPNKIPDYEKMKEQFYAKIDFTLCISVGWGIGFSHLDNGEKSRLLQKYYNDEVAPYYLNIAKRFKIVEFLKWMLEKYR